MTSTPNAAFPKGAEWRRWDLHVHTPFSALNNGFGDDFDEYAKAVFLKAIANRIAVVGVTDYFTIEGYKALRKLQDDPARLRDLLGDHHVDAARRILLLPNVEFRLNTFVRVGDQDSRVNAHVILSNLLPTREIEENFLHRLRFLREAAPGELDNGRTLTVANLRDFGARLKAEHAAFSNRTDLEVGMTQATVGHEQISSVLNGDRTFKGRYVFVVSADEDLSDISWDGQGHSTRKALIQKSHMLFSPNPGTRSFALGEKHESAEAFEREFKGRKPCIHGSDAHAKDELFSFADQRNLWIRADPTFDGLMQLCHEPEHRIYIGEQPPALQRLRESATKTIDRISFARDERAGGDALWFSGTVPLNPGLVAVIGKKGSGKSALADVVGLLGEAQNRDDFSFLTSSRFLNPKHGLAQYFSAEIEWHSGNVETKTFLDPADPFKPERVKYIPQSYLETICAEIQESSAPTLFDHELESVIFSHVPRADRLGQDSLQGLFKHTTEETEARIGLLRQKLSQVNREHAELRRASSADAKRLLQAHLDQRRAELIAHQKAKPQEVVDPQSSAEESPESKRVETELAKVVSEIQTLDDEQKRLRADEEVSKRRRVAVSRLLDRMKNFKSMLDDFYEQSRPDAELLELDARALLTLQDETATLRDLAQALDQKIAEISKAADATVEGSSAYKRAVASERAATLRKRLAEPQRRRQEYLRAIKNWQAEESRIVGAADDPTSVKGLEAKLAELSQLPSRAEAKRRERSSLVTEIFAEKTKLVESYKKLYSPVQQFMISQGFDAEVTALTFDAEVVVDGLEDGLLGMIHQGRRGSFQGEQEGRDRLRALIRTHDFSCVEGIKGFLSEIGKELTHDVRDGGGSEVDLEAQLVRGATVEGVYDFLFGLAYLQPRFKLLWRGKPIDQLSPGERGTLLLIFYLLVDRENMPLVLDQPEENLDNETVAELLVPAIKNARERRQIVMVTHNPNLAVVCDADQIIHASIDKSAGNAISYAAGSIEDPAIAQMIVDVLEGTKPAFDLRDAKYEVLDRNG